MRRLPAFAGVALGDFGASFPDFFRRAWPLVLIAAAVLAISIAEGRCSV